MQKFKTIRDCAVHERPYAADLQEALDEDTAYTMQSDASRILQLAIEIQTYAVTEAPGMSFSLR